MSCASGGLATYCCPRGPHRRATVAGLRLVGGAVGPAEDGYLLTLGPWTLEPPPAPTWREFFVGEGIAHQTEADEEEVWSNYGIWPEYYDQTVCEEYWSDRFEIEDSPCAKAHRLLRKIDVGPDRKSTRGPLLEFHQGSHPGHSSYWVSAKDQLSISLLQARLIDVGMPIKIVEGD